MVSRDGRLLLSGVVVPADSTAERRWRSCEEQGEAVSTTASKRCWYADGRHFVCLRCGNCCSGAPGYVWVSPEEIQAIADLLGMPRERFEQQHTRRAGQRQSLLELDDGDCEFLVREPDGNTHCAIHAARPRQCRSWPFWKSNLTSQRAWDAAAKHCPGMNQGQHHPLSVIQEALRQNEHADLPL
jgi:Fe-S-cluster containining protein